MGEYVLSLDVNGESLDAVQTSESPDPESFRQVCLRCERPFYRRSLQSISFLCENCLKREPELTTCPRCKGPRPTMPMRRGRRRYLCKSCTWTVRHERVGRFLRKYRERYGTSKHERKDPEARIKAMRQFDHEKLVLTERVAAFLTGSGGFTASGRTLDVFDDNSGGNLLLADLPIADAFHEAVHKYAALPIPEEIASSGIILQDYDSHDLYRKMRDGTFGRTNVVVADLPAKEKAYWGTITPNWFNSPEHREVLDRSDQIASEVLTRMLAEKKQEKT